MPVINSISEKRVYGFDLLRVTLILVILYFHVWQYTFFEDVIILPREISSYFILTEWVGPIFKYGGPCVLALSFFLIGFKVRSHHFIRFIILVIGVIGIQILSVGDPSDPSSWGWDIYSFLVFSYITVMLLPNTYKIRLGLVAISIAVLSLPYEIYASYLTTSDSDQFLSWSLFPWLALPLLYHSLGVIWREKVPGIYLEFKKWELPLWIFSIGILYWLSPNSGVFPAGRAYEELIFKQKPLQFWYHFSAFTFLMRLSVDPRFNSLLGKAKPIQWISSLRWNQRLGLCYLMQFIFLPLGPNMMSFWGDHPRLFDWLWLFIFVAVEILARVVLSSKALFKRIGIA